MPEQRHETNCRINGIAADYLNVNDRAIHYGDGVFETILCSNRQLYHWKQHYQRLTQSAQKIDLSCPDERLLLEDIADLLAGNGHSSPRDLVIKIILTRGCGERGYRITNPGKVNRIVSCHELEPAYSSLLTRRLLQGDLIICKTQASINESLAGIKHLNRLENVLARNEWSIRNGKQIIDGVMLNARQHVIECTMSNLFAVKNSCLYTPDLGQSGICGIIRNEVIKTADNIDIKVSITNMSINDLLEMDEIFITNSLIGMKAVNNIADTRFQKNEETGRIFAALLKTIEHDIQTV